MSGVRVIAETGAAKITQDDSGRLVGHIGGAPPGVLRIESQRDAATLLNLLDDQPTPEQRREFIRAVAAALAARGTRIRRRGPLRMFGSRA